MSSEIKTLRETVGFAVDRFRKITVIERIAFRERIAFFQRDCRIFHYPRAGHQKSYPFIGPSATILKFYICISVVSLRLSSHGAESPNCN